ncbi:uncharacterized protein with HEPN domain [Devosia sp. UYZn731]|uniref:HepT-like ribonuclease domain-containing protein n=1 Tax=Devosia sp. UYZn731 TaxID=3156345 RepID=UPI0033999226
MPSRDTQRVLATIKHNIVLARQFLADQTRDAFADNVMAVYAVTRCLEIISEASRRLPEEMKQRHPDVPWANIAGAGNVYRHDYEDVASAFVWKTVRSELDSIAQAVEAELTNSQ